MLDIPVYCQLFKNARDLSGEGADFQTSVECYFRNKEERIQ